MSELNKVFRVIVIVWLSVLTLVWIAIVLRWQGVCDRIALTVLKGMAGPVSPEVTYYRPKPWHQFTHAEKVEKVRAAQKRAAPSETHAEALERIGREQKELEAYLFRDSEPNRE